MTGARAVIAAAVVVLGVSACSGDDPEPKFAPSESPSPSAPSTSPASDSVDPVDAVEAWVDAQNLALQTGDTTELKALSATPCRGCDDFIEGIERVYRDGGHFTTDGWRVIAAEARPGSTNPVVVDVGVSIAGGETVVEAGEEPVAYESEKRILLFKLTPGGEGMLVNFVGFVE